MKSLERRAIRELPQLLADLLAVPRSDLSEAQAAPHDLELRWRADGQTYVFLVEARSSGLTAPVSQAIEALQASPGLSNTKRRARTHVVPLLVVPYMGDTGRQRCEEAGVSWVDLSGNAHVVAPPFLRLVVQGKPNRFKKAGRPPNPFAPKSSRVARCLLAGPARSRTQREISELTDVSEGFVSQLVHRLLDLGLVARDDEGAIEVPDPGLLLDAWRERYDFSKHEVVEARVMARAPELLLQELPPLLERAGWDHAFTGLAGAWLLAPHASYQLTTLYVRPPAEAPDADEEDLAEVLADLSFRPHAKAPNLWVVFPKDDGVFQFREGAGEGGARCVHPVQAYLDLAAHPERASEAAAELRRQRLDWAPDA